MPRKKNQYTQKIGLPPGSLVYVGNVKTDPVVITEFNFSENHCDHKTINNTDLSKDWEKEGLSSWIDINGIHDIDLIESLGMRLKLDAMVLEDIVNTHHQPKMEEFNNCLFVILKTLNIDDNFNIVVEQISIFLVKEGVGSFQESGSENFAIIKDRIITNKGTIRQRMPDYFFYRLIDTVVDHYFIVLEYFEDQLELLEKKLVDNPGKDVQQEIYDLKSKMSTVRKVLIPLRETISSLMKSDSGLIEDKNHKYFRDVYDHVIQIIDTLDSQRESVTDFLNLYMSGLSNKMNEVMKVLTIFAAIFIPLTFIAGIYGMNFEIMPELSWKYGYFVTWGVMITVAITLLVYFRRKKWL